MSSTNMQNNKLIVGAIIVAIVLGLAGIFLPKASFLGGASPTGSTFSTAKFAGVTVNLLNPGANGSSTSILNTDSNSRYITSLKVACSGLGSSFAAVTGTANIANLTLTVATTSAASPATITSPFATIITNGIIATGTPALLISSSTAPVATGPTATTSYADIWPAGSYVTFLYNATNTAVCTEGVDYIGS